MASTDARAHEDIILPASQAGRIEPLTLDDRPRTPAKTVSALHRASAGNWSSVYPLLLGSYVAKLTVTPEKEGIRSHYRPLHEFQYHR